MNRKWVGNTEKEAGNWRQRKYLKNPLRLRPEFNNGNRNIKRPISQTFVTIKKMTECNDPLNIIWEKEREPGGLKREQNWGCYQSLWLICLDSCLNHMWRSGQVQGDTMANNQWERRSKTAMIIRSKASHRIHYINTICNIAIWKYM